MWSNSVKKKIEITPEVYYASEIDKFAIKQTQLNFPNTIREHYMAISE